MKEHKSTPQPALGQIWRGGNPKGGFGHREDAEIIEMRGQSVVLRFSSGHEHGTTVEIMKQRGSDWTFVKHSK